MPRVTAGCTALVHKGDISGRAALLGCACTGGSRDVGWVPTLRGYRVSKTCQQFFPASKLLLVVLKHQV